MTLDALDKRLSYPFFLIELGALEIPLSPIFTWFGAPLPAMGFMPHLIALASPGGGRAAWAATAVALGGGRRALGGCAPGTCTPSTTRPVLPLPATAPPDRPRRRRVLLPRALLRRRMLVLLVKALAAAAGRAAGPPAARRAVARHLRRDVRADVHRVAPSGAPRRPPCVRAARPGPVAAAAALAAAGAGPGGCTCSPPPATRHGAAIALATGVALDARAAPLGLAHVAFGVPAPAARRTRRDGPRPPRNGPP